MGPTPSKSFNSCCKSLGVDAIAWQSSFWTCLRSLRKQSSHQSGGGGWFLLGDLGLGFVVLEVRWCWVGWLSWVVFSNRSYPWNSQLCHQPPQLEIRSFVKSGESHLSPNQNPEVKNSSPNKKIVENNLKATSLVAFLSPSSQSKKTHPRTHPLLWPSSASPRCLVFDSSMTLRSLRGYALGICNWDFPPLKRTKQNIWLLEINGWKMRFAFGG